MAAKRKRKNLISPIQPLRGRALHIQGTPPRGSLGVYTWCDGRDYTAALYTHDPRTGGNPIHGGGPMKLMCESGSCGKVIRVGGVEGEDPTPMWVEFKKRNSKEREVVPFYAIHGSPFKYDDQPLPVALRLQVDTIFEGGTTVARDQLNGPTQLIHAQDAKFANCWFSQAIDFGDKSGNPAFWILEKTAIDTWLLCLRRVSGEVARYRLEINISKRHLIPIKRFPLTLRRVSVNREFKKWPRTITIGHDK
jgi:hypothetical protein